MTSRLFNLPIGMPPPEPSQLDIGFWSAAAEGRLVVQQCASCGNHRFPPTESCYSCQSLDWTWSELSGQGWILSYVWLPQSEPKSAGAQSHYNVALIRLDGTQGEPVRMLSNIVDAWKIGDLEVGMAVELECITVGRSSLPCFRLSAAEHS